MHYTTFITVAIIASGASVHCAPVLGGCDTLGGVNVWHIECSAPLRPDVKGGSKVAALAAYCRQEETYVDCMKTKVLEHNCPNYAVIMAAVRNTMAFCVNGDVADWISDASFVNDEHCIPNVGEIVNGCWDLAYKDSPYGYNFEPAPFARGVEEFNRMTDRALPCVRTKLEKATDTTSPICTATSWQGVYNLFVLNIPFSLVLGLSIEESDLVSPNGDGLERELKRALLPDIWRQRRSTV